MSNVSSKLISEENNKMILNFILLLGVLAMSEAGLEPKVEIFEISGNRNGKGIKFRPLNLNHKNSQLAKYLLQNSAQPKAKTQPQLDIDIDFSQMSKFLLPNSNEIKERVQSPIESDSFTSHAKFLYQKGNQLKERPIPQLDLDSPSSYLSKILLESDAIKEKPQLPLDSDSSSQLIKLLFENNNQLKDKSLTLDSSDSSSDELGDKKIVVVDADALLGKISSLYKPKRNYEDEILAVLENKILDSGPDMFNHRSLPSKGVYPKESYIPYKTVLRTYNRDRNNHGDSLRTPRPVRYHNYANDY